MIDRDSYLPGPGGEEEFLADARALLATVEAYAAFDRALDIRAKSTDSQHLFDACRRGFAATAVDELGASCDLLADVAREFGAAIESDLRAAARLLAAMHGEDHRSLPRLHPAETTIGDASRIPEFKAWRRG